MSKFKDLFYRVYIPTWNFLHRKSNYGMVYEEIKPVKSFQPILKITDFKGIKIGKPIKVGETTYEGISDTGKNKNVVWTYCPILRRKHKMSDINTTTRRPYCPYCDRWIKDYEK